jgi:hypothetical protein
MNVLRSALRGMLIAGAALNLGSCGRDVTTRLDEIKDFSPSMLGRLAGVVTRANGAPAQGLDVQALNHGVVVFSAITDGSGAFAMSFENLISQSQPGDTLLTYFIQARAMVGSVSDSLVLREPVQVRMSMNRTTPPITNVTLRAGY